MELRDIEIFLTLAEELHFGRTAERLHVSTARVSQSIAKWERRVGVPLFERTSRRVTLTPIGRRLQEDIGPGHRQILAGIEHAVTAGREARGLLRVGFFSATGGQLVVGVADALRSRYPDCEVQIRELQFRDGISPLLLVGELDILLSVLPVSDPGLTASPVLFREGCLLAVCARHRFAGRDSITLADVAEETVLRAGPQVADYWVEWLAPRLPAGARPTQRGPVFATVQEMLALIGAGKGVFVFPAQATDYYQRPDVAFVPICDAPGFEWVFLWRRSNATARVRSFVETARDILKTRAIP
ncbi:LysR family transcriptional regulator [Kutzneria buriramensis]|uniref:DNA-binding transcriptional LysR family regulator n=1 Tax=Kutzneria buriramensis TaxID=1045776 RepID=A0A3E0HLY4_9PSEU|nr:LysR family transcriptional regulator [Kutzneria buriramensis]REH47360.1 DNA-binding transcriptional LysR family regulator [Kutzneria buriramensis]